MKYPLGAPQFCRADGMPSGPFSPRHQDPQAAPAMISCTGICPCLSIECLDTLCVWPPTNIILLWLRSIVVSESKPLDQLNGICVANTIGCFDGVSLRTPLMKSFPFCVNPPSYSLFPLCLTLFIRMNRIPFLTKDVSGAPTVAVYE